MEAIVTMSQARIDELSKIEDNLTEKTKGIKLFNNYSRRQGYSKYEFSGEVSDELVHALGRMPTEEEIIILVDRGFSHFGAKCTLNGNSFRGRVYID